MNERRRQFTISDIIQIVLLLITIFGGLMAGSMWKGSMDASVASIKESMKASDKDRDLLHQEILNLSQDVAYIKGKFDSTGKQR